MEENGKMYLGDGVYAERSGSMIKMYTFDGINESEPVYLEYQVWKALKIFVKARMEWES